MLIEHLQYARNWVSLGNGAGRVFPREVEIFHVIPQGGGIIETFFPLEMSNFAPQFYSLGQSKTHSYFLQVSVTHFLFLPVSSALVYLYLHKYCSLLSQPGKSKRANLWDWIENAGIEQSLFPSFVSHKQFKSWVTLPMHWIVTLRRSHISDHRVFLPSCWLPLHLWLWCWLPHASLALPKPSLSSACTPFPCCLLGSSPIRPGIYLHRTWAYQSVNVKNIQTCK